MKSCFQRFLYDDIGQLKTAKGWESDTTTARLNEQFGYEYDKAWNLNRRTNNALIQTFGVNNLNELTNATRSGTLTVARVASQPGANISGVTVSGTWVTTGAATVYADGSWAKSGVSLNNGANDFTATATDTYGRTASDSITLNLPATNTFSYDYNGNLTNDGNRVFEYDYENQLTNVSVASAWRSEFKYDAFGRRRVRKEYTWQSSAWVLTNEVRYIYDGMLTVQERDANNLAMVSYTRGNDLSSSLQGAGGIGGLLARTSNPQMLDASTQPQAHSYYHCDGNGNITALVNTNGVLVARYQYDPYGNMLGMSGPLAEANSYRFSSKEYAGNAALYYYGYRFYEPNVQRWLNRDPLGESGGGNLYQFASGNPTSLIDFWGLNPGQEFPTCDAAAIDALRYYERWTSGNNREYGGWIFRNPKGSFVATESVGEAIEGKAGSGAQYFKRDQPKPKPSQTLEAGYHTHTPTVGSGYDLPGAMPSDLDKDGADSRGKPEYIGVDYEVKKYTPCGTQEHKRQGEVKLINSPYRSPEVLVPHPAHPITPAPTNPAPTPTNPAPTPTNPAPAIP